MKKIITLLMLLMITFAAFSQEPESVIIGNQIWMKNNLNVGSMVTTPQTNNNVVEKYCYQNNPANCNLYGGLYNWEEAMNYMTEEGVQGICPDGWRLPTNDDIEELYTFLNGKETCAPALKKVGKWEFARATCTPQPNNLSGFSAIPSGTRTSWGTFMGNTVTALWWTSTKVEGTTPTNEAACYFGVRYCSSDIKAGIGNQFFTHPTKAQAISIRCIKE